MIKFEAIATPFGIEDQQVGGLLVYMTQQPCTLLASTRRTPQSGTREPSHSGIDQLHSEWPEQSRMEEKEKGRKGALTVLKPA